MIVEKTISGSWVISEVVDGTLITRRYLGYSKREAIREFIQDTADMKKPILDRRYPR